jgi:hypothetical protein
MKGRGDCGLCEYIPSEESDVTLLQCKETLLATLLKSEGKQVVKEKE